VARRQLNFIDTPGYLDFSSEGIHALRVADFAVVVIHAGHGIGVGTEMMWDYAGQFGIPRIIVVNALDKEQHDFDALVAEIRARFGQEIFPMQVPVDSGPGFHQVLDVLRSEIVSYAGDRSGKFTEVPAMGEWAVRVKAMHQELIEHIAESDDTLLQKFFDEGGLSEEVLRTGIHPAVQRQAFIPLFCTAGETNIGVARLLDFIAQFGSSPEDRQTVGAKEVATGDPCLVALNGTEPVAYVFKTLTDQQSGDLSIFRVYSGTVRGGMELYNSDRRITERLGQLYRLNGKLRTPVEELTAGDMGATVKLKDTHTGNTLCDVRHGVVLPKLVYPVPYTHAALQLNSPGDEDRLATGLVALHEEDLAFSYHTDAELHQFIISAQGELHLEVLFERLKRRYKVDIELVPPKIRYRETIRASADARYRHKKQSGGAGQFAEVWMRIEPAPRDAGITFTQSLTGSGRGPRVCALGGERRAHGGERRHPRRLPRDGCENRFLRRQDAHRGFEGHRVSDRGLLRVQGGVSQCAAGAAGADSRVGDPRAGGICRARGRRYFESARQDSRHGCLGPVASAPRAGAGGAVAPLRHGVALADGRTRAALREIQPLRGRAAGGGEKDRRRIRGGPGGRHGALARAPAVSGTTSWPGRAA
jgi:elongation factor G